MELTTLRGWIKQIKTERLDDHSRELIDGCFPEFLGQGQVSSWLKAADVSFSVTSKGTFPTNHGRLRRFAGDQTLPGGRYFSVCSDEAGADGGTLVWELMSYWTSRAKFFPNLIDSTVHTKEAEELRRSHPKVFGSANFLLLGVAEIESVTLEDGRPVIKLGKQIGKVLPLDVVQVEIASVLDLRLPSAQRWFTDTIGKLEVDAGHSNEFGIRTIKDYPASFRDILSTLITPSPGGNAFHQAVGAWLRNNSVFGLVFPSARRNGSLSATSESVSNSDGWNFVLYHDSPKVEGPSLFGLQSKWLRDCDVGIEIKDWTADDSHVHWQLSGPEEGERRRYDLQWEIRTGRRSESPIWESRFGAREY